MQPKDFTSMIPPAPRVLQLHLTYGLVSFDAIDHLLRHLQAGLEHLEDLEVVTANIHLPLSTCVMPRLTCEALAETIRGNPQLAKVVVSCRVELGSMDEIFRQTARLTNLRSLELGAIHKIPEDLQTPAYLHLRSLTLGGNVEDTVNFLSHVASPVLEALQLNIRFPDAPRYAYITYPSSSDALELAHFPCLRKVCRPSPTSAAHEIQAYLRYPRPT